MRLSEPIVEGRGHELSLGHLLGEVALEHLLTLETRQGVRHELILTVQVCILHCHLRLCLHIDHGTVDILHVQPRFEVLLRLEHLWLVVFEGYEVIDGRGLLILFELLVLVLIV